MKERFIRFLKDEGIYEKFVGCWYLNKEKNYWQIVDYEDMFQCDCSRYVDYAFPWHNTVDGVKYWDEIDDKWRKIVHKEQSYLIEHNGIKWSEDTIRSVLDKYGKDTNNPKG